MNALLTKLHNDEAGFIISAELVLVATIAVLGVIVGLSEVAWNVNEELEDVGSAFNHLDQSYDIWGTKGHQGNSRRSCFVDHVDYCGGQDDLTCGN
jgi:hypothetical protein